MTDKKDVIELSILYTREEAEEAHKELAGILEQHRLEGWKCPKALELIWAYLDLGLSEPIEVTFAKKFNRLSDQGKRSFVAKIKRRVKT